MDFLDVPPPASQETKAKQTPSKKSKEKKTNANAGGNQKQGTRNRKCKTRKGRGKKPKKIRKRDKSGPRIHFTCSKCACFYGKPEAKQQKTTKPLLCNGCERHVAKKRTKLMLAELKAFFIYAGVQVQIAPHFKSKKAKKKAYNDWICTNKARILKEPLVIEERSKFERSFKLNKNESTDDVYECVNTTPGRRVCYPVNDSPASHNISVQYMLKQRAKSTGKTKNRSKTTTKNNAAAGKKGENSTAARTCSQCFEKKFQDVDF